MMLYRPVLREVGWHFGEEKFTWQAKVGRKGDSSSGSYLRVAVTEDKDDYRQKAGRGI